MTSKRIMDLSLSIPGLIIAMPLMAVVAVVVRLRLGRPVLYRSVRPGWGGRPFTIIKFRSMTDARGPDGELLPDSERLTRFGTMLRATSLDELPELWNVLRGDMSLVGPRPLLMAYLDRYTAFQARRHEVRPGITGLAQIRGRNATTWERRLRLDVWYVDHRSLGLDLRIIAATILAVVGRRGISAPGHVTMPELPDRTPQ